MLQSALLRGPTAWRRAPLSVSKPTYHRTPRTVTTGAASSTNVFKKIARVLREKAQGDLDRISKGTSKTREQLGIVDELLAYWTLESSEDTLEELEDALIMADFGPSIALKVVDKLRDRIREGTVKTGDELFSELRIAIKGLLMEKGGSAELQFGEESPAVILIVGVNGGGKTTTIGKLAHRFVQEGAKVMLAPGDTFRAAAYEQLQKWADRAGASMSDFEEGKKPSSVLFKAVDGAIKSQEADVLLCDTSGRLHTNYGLMEELAKCKRTLEKRRPGCPDEVLLVLDGTTGLNMLNQAREFNEYVGLTGLILTKLDGTAKGGAVVSVVNELGVPVKFVGVGEGLDDLQPFDPESFVDALLPEKTGVLSNGSG
ncbi:hypothetical protein BSKO_03221 [Bryopsis sp. KO-2023]|nr:hypothetical protein BSKO_03221 [Bryopsis sp. KO-2023]